MIKQFFFILFVLFHIFLYCNGGTIIVVKTVEGLVFASDSLHTISNTSPFISSQNIRRFYLLTSNIVIGNINGNWQFHKLYDEIKQTIELYKEECGEEMSIQTIAYYCRKLINQHYHKAHIVLAGYQSDLIGKNKNDDDEGYHLFEVLPQGSLLEEEEFVVAGSGGQHLTTFFHDLYHPHSHLLSSSPSSSEKNSQLTIRDGSKKQSSSSYAFPQTTRKVVNKGGGSSARGNVVVKLEDALDACRRALRATIQYDSRTGGEHCSIWIMRKKSITTTLAVD